MGVLKYYSVILIVLMIVSLGRAQTPNKVVEAFDFCFKDSSLMESGVNFNGYFTRNDTLNNQLIISSTTNFIFFDNGLLVSGFYNSNAELDWALSEPINKYVSDINNKIDEYELFSYTRYLWWGVYKIIGDTLIARHIFKPGRFKTSSDNSIIEYRFKIVNSERLSEIDRSLIYPNSEMEKIHFQNNSQDKIELYFVSLSELPPSLGWPLYEEWFWCDKEEYAKWKAEKGLDPKLEHMPRYKQFIKNQIKK